MRDDRPKDRSPGNVLTVIIRDDAPLVNCGDSPAYRSVQVELTPEQQEKLALRHTFAQGAIWFAEDVSRCIIETKAEG